MQDNFYRIHQSLSITSAMESGVADRLRNPDDIIGLIDEAAPEPDRPKTGKT